MKPFFPWLYLQHAYPSLKARISLHLIFWLIIGLFIFSQHYISLRDPVHLPLLLSVLAIILLPIIFNYYLISLWGIPALLRRRYTDLISCLIIVYITTTAVYHYFIPVLSLEYGGAYNGLIAVYADAPLFIVLSKLSVLIYNYAFSFSQLSLPIGIKISKVINSIQRQQERLKGEKLQFELQALKGQIQPHFIFNSLNTIYDRALSQDLETAKQIIHLSNFLRYTVQEASEDLIVLQKEVWFIESYVSLAMNRHGTRVTTSFTQEGYLGDYKIPPLLLITYVENAFKHGVESTPLDAWVQIHLRAEKNGLFVFSVKNSHPCISSKGTGQGLANAKRRLALLFPQRHSLIIESNASSFNVTLTILLSTYENSETL